MQKTNIPWTEYSWNPLTGCELPLASSGCNKCYARELHNKRHEAYKAGKKLPVQYAKPFEEIQLFPDRLDEPLHLKEPSKIAVQFMGDLFAFPFEFINRVFDTIWKTNHTYQILTKRPEGIIEYLEWCRTMGVVRTHRNKYYPKIWTGVTVENPGAYNRIALLKDIRAAVKFLSLEPLLDGIKLTDDTLKKIDWVIIGAESKGRAAGRECKIEWVRSIVQQCQAAGVKCFVKQLHIKGKLVKNIEEFPEDSRVREFPEKT